MDEKTYPKVKIDDKDVVSVDVGSGQTIDLVEYDGYFLARSRIEEGRYSDHRTNIPKIVNMKVRRDDVFLIAYPKAGTHWTSEIIHMLLKGKSEYHNEPKEEHMLPFQTKDIIDQIPSPRVLNSHMMFRHLPKDILSMKNKFVFVNRNPKDLAVSFYHHCKRAIKFNGSWNEFLQFFMSERVVYHCPFYRYILDWEKCIKKHGLDVLYVTYENLTKDPLKEIARIAAFLNVRYSQEFYTQIADSCNFDQLKQNYESRPGSKPGMFRKGGVGGWKEYFTVSENEQFDKYLKEKLNNTSFRFTYEI